MALRVIFYNSLLLLVLVYAMARGGRSERAAALILFVCSLLTKLIYLIPAADRFGDVEYAVLLVDAAGLAGFTWVALKSDRFWPLWIAALQLIGILVHLSRMIEPAMLPTAYAFLLAIWAYPQLALIAYGTWHYHRRRLRMSVSSPSC
jgi:hypothetical protein